MNLPPAYMNISDLYMNVGILALCGFSGLRRFAVSVAQLQIKAESLLNQWCKATPCDRTPNAGQALTGCNQLYFRILVLNMVV
ncbi:MAG: hypothetical protein LBE91_21290 [Tannerella sp.]|nr:hypothetical protein [Tannerella sp.]